MCIESFTYPSEKNTEGVVSRWFPGAPWRLTAGGCGQTTPYTNAMWKKVTKDIVRTGETIDTVFIGGLGGGGHLPILKKFFPSCHITVAEHDPVIIGAAKRHQLYPTDKNIDIVEGDMFKVLAAHVAEGNTYDLVCVDLFTGREPSPTATHKESLALIQKALTPRGFFIINVFESRAYLAAIAPAFRHHKEVIYRVNSVGIFWDHE